MPKEKEVVKEHKHLETASERAPSPPPMFERSEHFDDRFSDIYCDRRTGARFSDRFSDKFSDRCSDRYSDRFSDTESLHNEVRTKLTSLQKAVKQRKRLSISTMSSSEFDGESVISEPTYSEYMERIRGKQASLLESQQSSRLSDLGDGSREIQGQTSGREARIRHSFEPQSKTRAIQLMKGELLPQAKGDDGEMEHRYRSFIHTKEDVDFKVMSSEQQKQKITNVDVPYSENERVQAQILPKYITASHDKDISQSGKSNVESMETGTSYDQQERMRAQRVTKWQKGEGISGDEIFSPETDLPLPPDLPYMEPEGYIQQEVMEKKESALTGEAYHHASPGIIRSSDNEARTAPHHKSLKINIRPEDTEFELPVLQAQSSLATEVAEAPSRTKARAEARIRDSPRLRPTKKDHFAGESAISQEITEIQDVYEEEYTGESLRAHYEKELEAERMECEEKLLALRIRKWQQGMITSEEDTFHPETDLPMPVDAPYMEPEGRIYTQEEMLKKELLMGTEPTMPTFHKSAKIKTEEFHTEVSVKQVQKSPRVKSRMSDKTIEASPRARARQERFEKMKEQELHLSKENISELKNESARFVSEEEALNERIMKWQQDVFMEQHGTVKLETDWTESGSAFLTKAEEGIIDTGAQIACSKLSTAEKVNSSGVTFQKLGDTPERPSTELSAEGRETRLEKDSEYLVSEQVAMAQRILNWQKDEITELESELPVVNQGKQLFEVAEIINSVTLPDAACSQVTSITNEKQIQKEASSKDTINNEHLQRHSPSPQLHTLRPEGKKYTATAKPFRQSNPPAPEESSEEYAMLVDKASLQHFQYEVREEGWVKDEVEPSREVTQRLQKDNASELEASRSTGVKESETKVSLKESVQPAESEAKTSINGNFPVFVKELSSLKVNIGEMSEFCCQFQGEPVPIVNWLKDGHPLAQNPDYDIVTKSNFSKLTLFYPTTDHVGTYECALSNKYGKITSNATLEISDEKETKPFERKQEVIITHEVDESTENLERKADDAVMSHTKTGKATLQVPKAVIHKQQLLDDSLSPSPVEIRITAATPVPEMTKDVTEDVSPAERTSDAPMDDSTSQMKHKFTFSFDVVGEAPTVVNEYESYQAIEPVQFSDGKAKTNLSVDKATPVHRNIILEEKAEHSQLEISQMAQKSRSAHSKESTVLSGCGLASSAAVINISQIKQTFESDSHIGTTTPSSDEQTKKTLFPKEFIPEVLEFPDHEKQNTMTELHTVSEGVYKILEENVPLPLDTFGTFTEEQTRLDIHGPQQFVEKVQDSPDLVKPKAQKPGDLTEQSEARVTDMSEGTVQPFERTSSFIPFQADKAPAPKPSLKASTISGEAVRPKITEPIKPERQAAISLKHSKAVGEGMETTLENTLEEVDVKDKTQEHEELEYQHAPVLEPSMDSGVFLSLPESQVDVTEATEVLDEEFPSECIVASSQTQLIEECVPSLVEPLHEKLEQDHLSLTTIVYTASSAEDKGIASQDKIVGSFIEGSSEIAPIVEAGTKENLKSSEELKMTSEARTYAKTVQSMQEEEVTFGTVFDFYNPPADWGRPLSPESEMSIEIGSTMSEEIAEVAERFYTPGSSTETSQQIADSFQTSTSSMSVNTFTSDSPGGYITPQEHPFSPLGYKRSSTGSLSDNFTPSVHYLPSPSDERIETSPPDIILDETRYFTGKSLLGLGSLQEKVQGIPPAFLKPLIKKRVFENDTLRFYAEVFGLPSPEVKWFCNKSQLEENSRIKMDRDGDSISLTVSSVTKADQGEYICEAINYIGEARSVALVVVVSQEVRFMPAPPAVTHQHVMEFDVEENDSSRSPSPQEILLEVELDEKDVKEFERQVKIITIPEYTADNKSMIISLDVLPSMYEEGAVDFVTQEHDDLKIAFEVTEMPPRFINPICDMEAHEGTTVMFECSLMGIPSPIISWFKGDKKIPHNKKFIFSSDGDNHFLKMSKITSQDSGVYTCRAINVVGETLCRASLVVLSAKAFAGKTRGRELTAVSLGSAKVQPQKFDLMVDNVSLDGEQVSEIELEFEFEQEADESQRAVRLVANTDKGTSEQGEKYVSINFDVFAEPAKDEMIEFKGKSSEMCSFHFQITETAPKCVIPLTNVTAAVGTPVILQCLVSGKPNPTAEWYKDGEPVTDSRCITQEKTAGHFNLLITNVTHSDAGEYKCLIQNSSGCIETTALLKVF